MREECLFSITFSSPDIPPLAVLRLDGREAMNELFGFDVVACAADVDPAAVETRLLGAQTVLSIAVPGGSPRILAGRVIDVGLLGRAEGDKHGFRLRIAPLAWRLTRRRNSRIFQDKTAPEIAAIVLGEHGVPHRMTLVDTYPAREYCVQYEETDWDFVTRLLAEEALFFWFEPPAEEMGTEVLAISDSVVGHASIEGSSRLRYRYDRDGALDLAEDVVTDFRSRAGIETAAFTIRDYDFERPGLDLTCGASGAELPVPGGAPLEHYEHHGEYGETDADAGHVRKNLEQLRARARTAEGTSVCRRLLPGHTFELVDHDVAELDRKYVVTSVRHSGMAPEIAGAERPYSNRLEAVSADTPFAPVRPARRLRQSLESAVVVGPAGHEIYCDEHGRVKVQFHWDRDGRRDEHSSCFLRVASAWAGAGFGHQFVPRIGMEVLVSFLGGDPDRPVVIGCLPNAHNPPPHALPHHRTRSGIRTRSSPGGGGSNEILFEDLAGAELLHVRAQRNLDVEAGLDLSAAVARHATETIGGEHRTSVGRHRFEETGGDHQITVGGGRTVSLGGRDSLEIKGLRSTSIGGADRTRVSGAMVVEVGGARSTRVQGRDELRVKGDRFTLVDGEETRAVLGPARTTFSGPCAVSAAAGIALSIGSKNKPASAEASLSGDLVLRGTGAIEICADKQIRFRVGKTVLTLGLNEARIESEAIVLDGKSIEALGEKGALSVAKEVTLEGEAVKLASKDKAILELDQEARLDGKAVKIKPGLAAEMKKREEREEQAKEVKKLRVGLFDLAGEAIRNAPYEVSFFGYVDEGVAADGSVEIPAFPDVEKALVRWGHPKDEGEEAAGAERYEYTMEVYLQLDAGSAEEALRRKLHNLGHGGSDLAAAVRHYQDSAGGERTGNAGDVQDDVEGRHGAEGPVKLTAA